MMGWARLESLTLGLWAHVHPWLGQTLTQATLVDRKGGIQRMAPSKAGMLG